MRTIRIASVLLGLLGAGCTLLLNTAEPVQCRTNGDCDGNPSLRGRVCEQGFCVVPTAPIVPVSSDAGEGCVTTEMCTGANSNRASLCRKAGEACIPLQTEACPVISGAWKDPKAIFVGSIVPLHFRQKDGSAPTVPYVQRFIRAVDLGLDEFNTASPQGILVGGQRRPLAVLHCDSYADPTQTEAVFDHLTQVAGAQALIVLRDEDLAAIADKATSKQVAIACSDCAAPLPQGPLAWKTIPPIGNQAPLAAWRVSDLETKIRDATGTTAPLRVAVLAEGSAPAVAFTQALAPVLKWNGKTVTQNGSDFFILTTGDPRKEAITHTIFAEQIEAFAPDIMVVAMGSDFPKHFLPHLESNWPAGKAKPHYILTDLSYEVAPFGQLAQSDELRKRFSGTHPTVTAELRANIDAYTIRYRAQYNNQLPDSNFSGYEAFYSLAFAITAASNQSILDGPHISSGFENLVAGTAIDLGPSKLNTAMALLSSGATVDVRGLWSNLDWNTKSRELEGDASMYCFTKDGSSLTIKDDAGPQYSSTTGNVTGTYACD